MGRSPCCDKTRVKKGPWSDEEDALLSNFMANFGNDGNWITLPKKAGLNRCGKSCRLRWINYLRPDVKHGDFTDEEDYIIYTLYNTIGSRWSMIASKLPAGRTDNEVKNYWNTKLKKKISSGKFDNNIMNSKFEISKHDHFMLFDQIGQNDIFNMEDIGENNIQKSYIITSDSSNSSSSSNSSVTPEISSSTSSSVDSTNNSNSNNSVLFGGEEDEFWMDLLSDSFDDDDDVVVVGSRLDDKINEIASLLYD